MAGTGVIRALKTKRCSYTSQRSEKGDFLLPSRKGRLLRGSPVRELAALPIVSRSLSDQCGSARAEAVSVASVFIFTFPMGPADLERKKWLGPARVSPPPPPDRPPDSARGRHRGSGVGLDGLKGLHHPKHYPHGFHQMKQSGIKCRYAGVIISN